MQMKSLQEFDSPLPLASCDKEVPKVRGSFLLEMEKPREIMLPSPCTFSMNLGTYPGTYPLDFWSTGEILSYRSNLMSCRNVSRRSESKFSFTLEYIYLRISEAKAFYRFTDNFWEMSFSYTSVRLYPGIEWALSHLVPGFY